MGVDTVPKGGPQRWEPLTGVQPPPVVEEEPDAGHVGDQQVDADGQADPVARQDQRPHFPHRPLTDRPDLVGHLLAYGGGGPRAGLRGAVGDRERDRCGIGFREHPLGAVLRHHRAQHVVPGDQRGQRCLQPAQVQVARLDLQVEVGRDIAPFVAGVPADEVGLLETGESKGLEPMLRVGVESLGLRRRLPSVEPVDHQLGELLHGRTEEGGQRKIHLKVPFQHGAQFHGAYRFEPLGDQRHGGGNLVGGNVEHIAEASTQFGRYHSRPQGRVQGREQTGQGGAPTGGSTVRPPIRYGRGRGRRTNLERFEQCLELVGKIAASALAALDLAADRLGDLSRRHQNQVVHVHLVLRGHRGADTPGQLRQRNGERVRVRHGLYEDQLLAGVAVHGERRRGRASKRWVCPLAGRLDVVGVEVAAPHNDHLLAPAAQHQLAVVQEGHVAGTEIRTLAVGQPRAERLLGQLRTLPIALAHDRAADPHLADLVLAQPPPALRVDHDHFGVRTWLTDPDQAQPAFALGGGCYRGRVRLAEYHRSAPFQLGRVHVQHERPAPALPGQHHGLGHAEAGAHGSRPEAVRLVGLDEPGHAVRLDALGGVEGGAPAGQVEPRTLLLADLIGAEAEGEVRRAGQHRPRRVGDGAQPAQGVSDEVLRRQEHRLAAEILRQHEVHDDSERMVGRYPADHVAAGRELEDRRRLRQLVHQIVVADHHTLRPSGGPGGVLQQGQIAPVDGREGEWPDRRRFHVVHRDPRHVAEPAAQLPEPVPNLAGRHHRRHLRVGRDLDRPLGARIALVAHGWRAGHDDRAGVERAEQTHDEVQARRGEYQHAVAGEFVRAQHVGQRAAQAVQFGTAERDALPVLGSADRERQVGEGDRVRIANRVGPQHVDDGAAVDRSGDIGQGTLLSMVGPASAGRGHSGRSIFTVPGSRRTSRPGSSGKISARDQPARGTAQQRCG
ncbi:hypothetical protein SNARM312S_06760 [Streptomyces narbonensis]